MKHTLAILVCSLVSASCASGPAVKPPAVDKGNLAVSLKAIPKAGIKNPRAAASGYDDGYGLSGYDAPTKATGQFERVNYAHLSDIAVLLEGAALDDKGMVPRAAKLEAGERGFDHDLALLGPNGMTQLTIVNDRDTALDFFCAGDKDGFDVSVGAGKSAVVTLKAAGMYELLCAQDDKLHATLIVAPNSYACLSDAGDEAVFENVAPGSYSVRAVAARLPEWKGVATVAAGQTASVTAELTVNSLPSAR